MSVVQSLAIAAAALMMSYTVAPPVTARAALEHAAALAQRAEISAQLFVMDLSGQRPERLPC